jgi:DNA-binding CsgD family transcriptional regulator
MTILNESSKAKYKLEFERVIKSYNVTIQNPDYAKLESIKKCMIQVDLIENRPTYVIDLFSNNFLFVSGRYFELLGHKQGNQVDYDFFFNALHPDDYRINIEAPLKYIEYLKSIPQSERYDYKLVSDYRLKVSSGEFIRVIEDMTLLETDDNDNPWLVLAICDLSVDQNIKRNSGAILVKSKEGRIVFNIGNCEALMPFSILTKREFEILKLIAKGNASKQIADKLCISINTINNHRRNILSKTGCSNTFEAMKYLGNFL